MPIEIQKVKVCEKIVLTLHIGHSDKKPYKKCSYW